MANLDRSELVKLVQRIMDADGSESAIDDMLSQVEANVPDPNVVDLIFWPPNSRDLSAEEVVDKALAYRPTVLPGPESRFDS